MGNLKWLDRLKGAALLWIVLSHLVEPILGSAAYNNPDEHWPPFVERVAQLAPLSGYGRLDVPVNLLRYLGWHGDSGVAVFLIATGFGLAWGLSSTDGPRPLELGAFYRRRLMRLFPMWLIMHAVAGVLVFTGVIATSRLHFLLSAVGIRVLPKEMYAVAPPWWFVPLLIQVYLVFPLLWWLARRSLKLLLVIGVAALIVRGVGLAVFVHYLDAWSRGAIVVTRLPEVLFGIALAVVMRRDFARLDQRLRTPAWTLAGVSCALLGFALSFTLPGMTVAPLLLGAGIVLGSYGSLAGREELAGRDLLAWLGRHSYSIYLVHAAAIFWWMGWTRNIREAETWLRILAASVSTVVGCVLLEWIAARLEPERWQQRRA